MAAEDVPAEGCEPAAEHLARAFGFLGKRWTAVILGHLSHGPTGFRDLSRGIGGISDSVLSERLADLAAGGLITRTVCDGHRPSCPLLTR
jgi:DNA-binding HxlR family transcriptional regulator